MTMYTVVRDSYDVDLYRTLKSVSETMASEGVYFADEDDGDTSEPATAKLIAKALRKSPFVRLSERPDESDWKYRIEKQYRSL